MKNFTLKNDKVLSGLIRSEIKRQGETLDLIPSENIASEGILSCLGSPLTNKYSEGYPGKRYYPGNIYCDEIENLAIERAKKVFKLGPEWQANVQPYSGSPANLAVYLAFLGLPSEKSEKSDDSADILGMTLASGGHLTHGHPVNLSGRLYKAVQYSVNPNTGFLDYDEIESLAVKHKPKIIVSGLTAYPRTIDFERFGQIAKKTGAFHLADISHIAGLIAAGLRPSPFPYADVVMTTTHKTLKGPRGAIIFANKNSEAIDKAVFPGMQGGPHDNVTAAIAFMFFEASRPWFRKYQKQILKNAKVLADSLTAKGCKLVTGGTDNHLMLMDVRNFGLDGLKAEKMLESVGIIANRNSIPGDTKPFRPSGIRMGTPSVTARGMKEKEMRGIAELVYKAINEPEQVSKIHLEVKKLCQRFPL